jgi:hypothetical protein
MMKMTNIANSKTRTTNGRATVTVTDHSFIDGPKEVYKAGIIVTKGQTALQAGWDFLAFVEINPTGCRVVIG